MAVGDERLLELAGAVLDGTPIDWSAAASEAGEADRALIEDLRALAAVVGIHREPGAPAGDTPLGSVLRSSGVHNRAAPHESTRDSPGDVIGAYRVVRPLGHGGMGEVYLGERTDGRFEQTVAVKLVRRGMDSSEILRRFARERRILARLQHPGIARLLDAGETPEGRPYFVMERVEGEPITRYCRDRDLPLEGRLQLVASCCDAVDAAHRALVVHRDLKPSNILVTASGQVKLLDFGIATLLGGDADIYATRPEARLNTPAYAAPEQLLGGGVTTATDVFALGVVLYELLTGELPFDRSATTPSELADRVERETAERASAVAARAAAAAPEERARRVRWARRLRGDVDTILEAALAREPHRRYPSAAALADDLRRYLTSRPIRARPNSTSYRVRRFVGRHRTGLAASVVVAASLIVALAVALDQMAAARREADRASAAQAFLTSLFEQIDPDRYVGSAPTVRDLLELGSERLDRDLAQQPELRADMQALLGQLFDQLSAPAKGEALWRRAVESRERLFGGHDPRTAKARKGLAISLARQGRFAQAEPLFRQLVADETLLDARDLGSVLLNYGNHKRLMGDPASAEALLVRSVAVLESAGESGSRSLAAALSNLGHLYWQQGHPRDALGPLKRALAIRTRLQGPRSSVVAYAHKMLSHVYRDLGELDIAESYAREALAVAETLFPANHPFIATTFESLGQIAEKRGDRAGARALYEQSIQRYERADQADDVGLAESLRCLAALRAGDGAHAEALPLYERALATRRRAFGDRHRDVAASWQELARARLSVGDTDGALAALTTSIDVFRAVPGNTPQLAGGLLMLGDVLLRSGRPREALTHLEEARALWRLRPPSDPGAIADVERAIAAARAPIH